MEGKGMKREAKEVIMGREIREGGMLEEGKEVVRFVEREK